MAVFQNEKAEILHLECTLYRDPYSESYNRLCDGHHPSDCEGLGGTWYYKGDKAEAQRLVDIMHAKHKERADAYYSRRWV